MKNPVLLPEIPMICRKRLQTNGIENPRFFGCHPKPVRLAGGLNPTDGTDATDDPVRPRGNGGWTLL
jgi:hypothetical protein